MIEQLLKEAFPVLYGLNPDKVRVPMQTMDKPFVLSDEKTCSDCQSNPLRANRIHCNREILKVNNNGTSVNVVWFEDYIYQFRNTHANVQDRCDIILTDSGVNHSKKGTSTDGKINRGTYSGICNSRQFIDLSRKSLLVCLAGL